MMNSSGFNGLVKALQCLPVTPVDGLFDDLLARLDAAEARARTFTLAAKLHLGPSRRQRVLRSRQQLYDRVTARALQRRAAEHSLW